MKAFGGHELIVKILVVIGFAVVVQIVITGNLIAARGVDHVVHDREAERFVLPRSEAAPLKLFELVVKAGDNPDITVVSAKRGALAIGEKVHPAQADTAVAWISVG